MAEDITTITSFNFNDSLLGQKLNDKQIGLDIIFGYISGLPFDHMEIGTYNRGLAIALMNKGIGQGELDRACKKLSGQCHDLKCDILITKSDLPFDSRWFIIGDLAALLDFAQKDEIKLPFSAYMIKHIREIL